MRHKLVASLAVLALATPLTGARVRPETAAGSISGTVTFTGTPPRMRPIDMSKEPTCAAQHTTPVMNETIVAGPGNAVQNVVVYISAGDQASTAPTAVARYDQRGCEYLPHVLVMQVGQALEVYNDDQTSHNIHPLAQTNPEWNKSQPPGAPPIKASYDRAEFIPVKCNIHPWMHGYFVVLSTSHRDVTGNDGKFTIAGLPPGKYTVTAWHEKFGTLNQEIEVTATGTAAANFVFKALPY
ncbi:MAG: carboxypeptidase regulatory-like domain-containing protein [Gemmatimonadota bacterium]